MEVPRIPDYEAARLLALYELNILDTDAEERFDRVTRLGKRLFGVPMCLLSLVDKERQWFKSRQGLDASETPRAVSFCGHTILEPEIMVVPDALDDPRFVDNPLVVDEPYIRFYAGCPVVTPDGHRVGTFCIIDSEPRELDSDDLDVLRDLGEMIEEELKLAATSMTDQVTQISNSCGFEKLAQYSLRMCHRFKKSMTLLNINLDQFQMIDERFGRTESDKALKAMASILVNSYRESDVIARLGTDDFCVLCSDVPEKDVHVLLERLQAAVETYNTEFPHLWSLHYSINATLFDPQNFSDVATLLAQAIKD